LLMKFSLLGLCSEAQHGLFGASQQANLCAAI
jgi:hypothetical protein